MPRIITHYQKNKQIPWPLDQRISGSAVDGAPTEEPNKSSRWPHLHRDWGLLAARRRSPRASAERRLTGLPAASRQPPAASSQQPAAAGSRHLQPPCSPHCSAPSTAASSQHERRAEVPGARGGRPGQGQEQLGPEAQCAVRPRAQAPEPRAQQWPWPVASTRGPRFRPHTTYHRPQALAALARLVVRCLLFRRPAAAAAAGGYHIP
jgi:hypothetical protein